MKRRNRLSASILGGTTALGGASILSGVIGVCAGLLLLVNTFRIFTVGRQSPTFFWNISISSGAVWYGWTSVNVAEPRGWFAFTRGPSNPNDSEFEKFSWWPRFVSKPLNGVVVVPLWMISVTALGVSIMSAHSLKTVPGNCVCGYNRAGLAANTPCPDCGRLA